MGSEVNFRILVSASLFFKRWSPCSLVLRLLGFSVTASLCEFPGHDAGEMAKRSGARLEIDAPPAADPGHCLMILVGQRLSITLFYCFVDLYSKFDAFYSKNWIFTATNFKVEFFAKNLIFRKDFAGPVAWGCGEGPGGSGLGGAPPENIFF